MKKNLVTIAIPAYKSRFLERAIQSALRQTYENIELVIVNDESPEKIDEVVSAFNDRRIRYVRNASNIGGTYPARNWNRCLHLAKGEFFVLFSDDDIYEPAFVEELYRLSETYPQVSLFHTRVKIIDDHDRLISYTPACPEIESGLDFMWHRFRGCRVQYAPDFMCRTEALRASGGFHDLPLAWGSDDITWFKVGEKEGVAYSSKALCNWRSSSMNISSAGNIELRFEALKHYAVWTEGFLRRYGAKDLEEKQYCGSVEQEFKAFLKMQKLILISAYAKRTDMLGYFLKMRKWQKQYDLGYDQIIIAMLRAVKTSLYRDKK